MTSRMQSLPYRFQYHLTADSRRLSPDLSVFPEPLRQMASDRFEAGYVSDFLLLASNELGIEIVSRNLEALRSRGLLEAAIVDAIVGTRTNNSSEYREIDVLMRSADRVRLLAAGDTLPSEEPFQLYRGAAGSGRARRIRGYSWTPDRKVADWFAKRSQEWGLRDPAVYSTVVPAHYVLFYSSKRKESEFFLSLPSDFPVTRL